MVLIHNEPFRPKAHDPVYHLMSLRAKRFIVYQNHVMIYFIIDLYISDAIFMAEFNDVYAGGIKI